MPGSWRRLYAGGATKTEEQNDFVVSLLESIGEGLYVIDRSGDCILCNRRCVDLLGYDSKAEIVGRNMHGLIHHSHRDGSSYDESTCPIYRAFLEGERVEIDNEVFWRRDGSTFDVAYSSYPVAQDGETVGAVITFTDITERRRAEAELLLRTAAIDQATDGVLITDPCQEDNPIIYANARIMAMTGYGLDELLGRNCRFLQGPDTDRDVVARIRESVAGGRECSEVLLNYRKDGTAFWNELRVSPVLDGVGELVAFVGVQTDVTARVEQQIALETAQQAAEAANQAKTEFLSHVTHEIRSPMTSVLGYTDLLRCEPLSDAARDYVETVRRNGAHLLELVNDLLDMSRIEAGRLSIEDEEVDFPQFIEEIRSLISIKAHVSGAAFSIRCETPIPSRIRTDAVRLRQVLINLLTNAFKFTEAGQVELLLSYEPANENAGLRMAIRDSGTGIAKEALERLFQPFMQATRDRELRSSGAGLGLTIAHRLVEAMGGSIDVESTEGVGSTFTVWLPTKTADDVEVVEQISAVRRPSRGDMSEEGRLSGHVLVVDDRRDIRHLLDHFLSRAGITCEFATNGKSAIRRMCEGSADEAAIDLVMLDMHMPTMDGYEAARRLRRAEVSTPIIAMTANASRRERRKCLDAGCNDFIAKPIDLASMMATLGRWLSGKERSE